MIAVDCPQKFVPTGKKLLDDICGPYPPDLDGVDPTSGIPRRLYHSGKALPAKEKYFGGPCWRLESTRDATDVDPDSDSSPRWTEEEFVWKHNVLAVTRGVGSARETVRCQTEHDTILDVFHVRFSDPMLTMKQRGDVPTAETLEDLDCLCVIMPTQLSLYSKTGKKFDVSVPFVVRQAWPSEFGVILERKVFASEGRETTPLQEPGQGQGPCQGPAQGQGQVLPMVYSLVHPHGEILPVAVKPPGRPRPRPSPARDRKSSGDGGGGGEEFVQDKELRLVGVFEDLPLAVFYNAALGNHFVCWIRPFHDVEVEMESHPPPPPQPGDREGGGGCGAGPGRVAPRAAPTFMEDEAEESARRLRALSLQPEQAPPPGCGGLPGGNRRRSGCPGVPYAPGGPVSTTRDFQTMMSESASVIRDPGVRKKSDFGYEPIKPELCLVKIWEETPAPPPPQSAPSAPALALDPSNPWDTACGCRKAVKSFFAEDFSGSIWLCLLLPREQGVLKMIEVTELRYPVAKIVRESRLFVPPYRCGKVVDVPAVGACPVDSLKLLLVEQDNGALLAYSGPTKVEKVLVNGQLSCFLSDSVEDLLAFRGTEDEIRPRPEFGKQDEDTRHEMLSHCRAFDSLLLGESREGMMSDSTSSCFGSRLNSSGGRRRGKASLEARLEKILARTKQPNFKLKLEFDGEEADWIEPGNLFCCANESVILRREESDGTVSFLRLEMPALAECPIGDFLLNYS